MYEQIIATDVGSPSRPEPVMPSACESGGCGGGAMESDPRIRLAPPSFGTISINGVDIEAEAIAQEIQHHPADDGEKAWQEAARALALRELLLQEAHRQGLHAAPEVDEAGRCETEEDAIVRALLERQLQPATAGEEECRRYYEGHIARFRTPDLFEASHILIEPGSNNEQAWTDARARARTIAAEVGDNLRAFAAAAREFSQCPTAHQDGSLGQVRRGELVTTVQKALEALAEGTTGREPVCSQHGWHVLRLQRRIKGRTLPFDRVKDKIADMLEARAWAVAATRYATELAASAKIEGVLIEPSSAGVQ